MFFNFVFTLSASDSKQIKALNKNGIFEKQASVGNVIFNYAEGPDNGPVLLMLHAQLLDWYTYHLILSELSKNFGTQYDNDAFLGEHIFIYPKDESDVDFKFFVLINMIKKT